MRLKRVLTKAGKCNIIETACNKLETIDQEEKRGMNRFKRGLSACLCLLLTLSGLPVSADAIIEETPGIRVEETTQPPAETEKTTTDAPVTDAPATDAPMTEVPMTEAPTTAAAPEAEPTGSETYLPETFHVTFERTEISAGMSQTPLNLEKELKPQATQGEKLVWTVTEGDGAEIYRGDADTGREIPEGTEAENAAMFLRVKGAGKYTVRAALASEEKIYAQATVTITEDRELKLWAEKTDPMEGETVKLTLQCQPETEIDLQEVEWTASDECVRIEAGQAVCLKPGSAVITARWRGLSAQCEITVSADPAEITAQDVTLYSNQTGRVQWQFVEGAEGDAALVRLVPQEGSEGWFTLDEAGNLTPVVSEEGILASESGAIESYVDVTYKSRSVRVKVVLLQAVTSAAPVGEMALLRGQTLETYGKYGLAPMNHQDKVVALESGDETIFTLDENGVIHGAGRGTAQLRLKMESGNVLEMPVRVMEPTQELKVETPTTGYYKVGETAQMTLRRTPAEADDPVTWSVSDANLAEVDANGLVNLKAPGGVMLTATAASGAQCQVYLEIIRPVTGMEFYLSVFPDVRAFTLAQGQSVTPVVKMLPENATHTGYALFSSDPAVAVIQGGRIVGVKPGVATVTLESADGMARETISITVVAKRKGATSLRISPSSLTLYEGTGRKLRGSVNSSAANKGLIWASTNPQVATVDANGYVTALEPGTCSIYCMNSAGVFKKCTVRVKAQLPKSVKLNKRSGSMYPDDCYQLTYTISPANVRQEIYKTVTWTTSNPAVAFVSDEGMVYAVAPGRATITARTANGKRATCRVTVKKRGVTSLSIVNPYGDFQVGGVYTLTAAAQPENATDASVKWTMDSRSRKLASIDANTGLIYCKKAGTIRVTATAKDGSRKKATISINIGDVALESMRVLWQGEEIAQGQTMTLEYGQQAQAECSVAPQMYLEWTSSNARIVSVENGLITARRSGQATITAMAAGRYAFSFVVNVPRDESQPRYRALLISQYQSSREKGYLPFAKNSAQGFVNAVSRSDLEGEGYEVTYKQNLTSASQMISAIESTFADAKEGDVSVIYVMTHGVIKNGEFCWYLKGSGSKGTYVYASQVMPSIQKIKGNVVLMVLSCYSGGSDQNPNNLTGMMRQADEAAGEGGSYSVVCASDGTKRASYSNTAEKKAYDFFTLGICESLGWDFRSGAETDLRADLNGDGKVSIEELAAATAAITSEECQAYLKKYGSSSYWGPTDKRQDPSYYVSPKARNLNIFGK